GRRDQLGEWPEALHPGNDLPLGARPELVAQASVVEPLLDLGGMVDALLDAPGDVPVEEDLDVLLLVADEDAERLPSVGVDVDPGRRKGVPGDLELLHALDR